MRGGEKISTSAGMAPKPIPPELGLSRAIRAMGSGKELSRRLGLHETAVSKWSRVPAEHVLTVERLTGIPPHELRSDIYPPSRFA